MRGLWILVALLVPALSGCTTSDGGGIFDFITGSSALDGECGHVYNDNLAHQIIISVVWTNHTIGKADADEVEVSATYFGKAEQASSGEAKAYAEKYLDDDGCVGFEMMEPGSYSFWAFGEAKVPDCFVQGRLDGTFNGEEIVGGTLVMDGYLGGDHC